MFIWLEKFDVRAGVIIQHMGFSNAIKLSPSSLQFTSNSSLQVEYCVKREKMCTFPSESLQKSSKLMRSIHTAKIKQEAFYRIPIQLMISWNK